MSELLRGHASGYKSQSLVFFLLKLLFTYISGPTLAIAPILLEDMRRVAVERKGETNFFTSQMIKDCMKKVVACNLHQVVKVDDELEIKAYYAGKCKHIYLFSETVIAIFGVLKNKEGKYYIFQNSLKRKNGNGFDL